MPRARLLLLVALAALLASCGGARSTRAGTGTTGRPAHGPRAGVARTEAAELVDQCSTESAAMVGGLNTSPRCALRTLKHLSGTLWRARLDVPPHTPTSVVCVTFDVARYVRGSRNGQIYGHC